MTLLTQKFKNISFSLALKFSWLRKRYIQVFKLKGSRAMHKWTDETEKIKK
jgi:hypothetical protein